MKKLLLIICLAFAGCQKAEPIDPNLVINDYICTFHAKSGTFKIGYRTTNEPKVGAEFKEETITGVNVTKVIKCNQTGFDAGINMNSIPSLVGDSLYMKVEMGGKSAEKMYATKLPNTIIKLSITTTDLK
jgi:hypothetical protein